MTAEAVWQIATGRLQQINMNSYTQWFSKMVPLRVEETTLVLGVPDEFFGQFVVDCCGDFLVESLHDITGIDYEYSFEPGHCAIDLNKVQIRSAAPAAPAAAAPVEEVLPAEPEKDFEQPDLFAFDCEPDSQSETAVGETPAAAAIPAPAAAVIPAVPEEAPAAPVQEAAPIQIPGVSAVLPRWNINSATFENFIVSDDNNGAYTAARAVSSEPGILYNPLFIYGTNGIGKTHLLQAIAHEISESRPGCTVRCVPCSDLVNDFYRILSEHRSTVEFRDQLLESDVLLIDDVHGLAKKVQMQEEFFSVFNTLIGKGKQIVMTCDRQPCDIADIDKRLTTRFESGVICQIGMPEYEERVAILRMWRDQCLTKLPLPDAILDFLAENISSNVRRLKGCFLRLSAYAEMNGIDELSIPEAEKLLHATLAAESSSRDIKPEKIQQLVANHFGITLVDLAGKCRARHVADPRMIAMYLCREMTRLSSNEIGNAFGRTHANVLHAAKTISDRCRTDETLRRNITLLEKQLQK